MTAGLEPDKMAEARKQSYHYVSLEVNVRTVVAMANLRGDILIGNSQVRVSGAGIEGMIADIDAQNLGINNDA